jgi:hypothetical protein
MLFGEVSKSVFDMKRSFVMIELFQAMDTHSGTCGKGAYGLK